MKQAMVVSFWQFASPKAYARLVLESQEESAIIDCPLFSLMQQMILT